MIFPVITPAHRDRNARILILPWMMHGMGAGDVKLMMAIGVWLGPVLTLASFCVGAVAGGIIATVMIVSTGRL